MENTIIQRCIFHLQRYIIGRVSKHPKTGAGLDIYLLAISLGKVDTKVKMNNWIKKFSSKYNEHQDFINEISSKTYVNNNDPNDTLLVTTWSRHKKFKSAYNHILFALKNNQLFHYLDTSVPNTSNEVEGGINARLKELIRSHRGTTIDRKRIIVEWYLLSKSEGGIEAFIKRYF